MDVKKRLIYYIWLPNEHTEFMDKIYKLHLNCLNSYADRFTDVILYVAIDEDTSPERIASLRKEMMTLSWKSTANIEWNIIDNDPTYRESKIFYEEIACKLKELDGLTFFAHMRGLTRTDIDFEWHSKWICLQYFLNLNYEYDYRKNFDGGVLFYANLLSYIETLHGFYFPMGTFLWINGPKAYYYAKKNNIEIPPLYGRSYSEDFMYNICPFDFDYISSYEKNLVRYDHLYNFANDTFDEIISLFCRDENNKAINEFYDFYNKTMENVC